MGKRICLPSRSSRWRTRSISRWTAKRSSKRASPTRIERMSKSAVFTRSIMGRVPVVLGALSLRPFASPVTMFIRLLLVEEIKYGTYFLDEIIFFCPGNERLHLVHLHLFYGCGTPGCLYQSLQLFVIDLRVQDVMQY